MLYRISINQANFSLFGLYFESRIKPVIFSGLDSIIKLSCFFLMSKVVANRKKKDRGKCHISLSFEFETREEYALYVL